MNQREKESLTRLRKHLHERIDTWLDEQAKRAIGPSFDDGTEAEMIVYVGRVAHEDWDGTVKTSNTESLS